MVEVNPRPRKPSLFIQVFVAVISGAAAMNFIQSFHPAESPASAPPANPPEAASKAPPAPSPAEVPAAAPDAAAAAPAARAAPPAAVSMLVLPEPGGASGGVVALGGDDPPANPPPAPPPPRPAPPEAAAAPPRSSAPVVHLRPSGLSSRYVGSIGKGFQSSSLSPPVFSRKEAPKPAPAAAPAPAIAPAPRFITYARTLEGAGIAQKDIFVPSAVHPEIVPDKPFWDYERKRKAALSGLVALFGAIYLLSAMGFFTSFIAKPRVDDEPRW